MRRCSKKFDLPVIVLRGTILLPDSEIKLKNGNIEIHFTDFTINNAVKLFSTLLSSPLSKPAYRRRKHWSNL